MKINEMIERVNTLIPNQFEDEQLVYWVNIIEASIQRDFFGHERAQQIYQYRLEDDRETELMAPPPYDDLYVNYVAARVAYTNQETEQYNNFNELFSGMYEKYKQDFTRVQENKELYVKNWF